jgi:inhibitor of KinA sporulation pathway (predicted exonuclease)
VAATTGEIRHLDADPRAPTSLLEWGRAPYYLVIDLEATTSERGRAFPAEEMETIEIGAVLICAATLEIVGEFRTFVRPIRHPVLLPFCTTLTGITQDAVDGAPLFPQAFATLRRHILAGREGVVWGSWGRYDDEQLRLDCALHSVPYNMPPHLDLKEALSTAQGWGRRYGLSKALTRCGLSLDGDHHRALDDARNTVRMLPWIVGGRRAPRRAR